MNNSIADKNKSICELAFKLRTPSTESHVVGHHVNFNARPNYERNYYYNIADLWPLVVEYKVSLVPIYDNTAWSCCTSDVRGSGTFMDNQTVNENPQHALADCLLAVLEAKEE